MKPPENQPMISVLMPVFNQKAGYLKTSIESILHQTYDNFELIIIDDGSTEKDTISILTQYAIADSRIRIERNQKNTGIIHSLNRALEASRGTLIARMDSDDIALPRRLERQVAFLKEHPTYDLIGTWVTVIDGNDSKIGSIQFPTNYETIKRTILARNPIIHPTWMFRRSLMEAVGNYNESAILIEDYDFLLRVARNHRITNIPEILLEYRFNAHGLSFSKNKIQEKNGLKIRIKALKRYNYPLWQMLYLIYPVVCYFLIPPALKRALLRLSFKKI